MTSDVIAKLRYLRIAPRKVRLVLDLIRGKDVLSAAAQLEHLPKGSSRPLLKLLKSAEANAEHNFKLDPKSLIIRQAFADEGPKLKRYQPHAFGRATVVMKRSSHVTIILSPKRGKTPAPIKPKEDAPVRAGMADVKRQPSEPSVKSKRATTGKSESTAKSARRLSHPGEKSGQE